MRPCITACAVVLALLISLFPAADLTRIRGSWRYDLDNRLSYLTKFGVQRSHEVFAYGSSVRSKASHVGLTDSLVLAFVPSSTWDSFYDVEKKTRRTCKDFMAGPFNTSTSPDSRCSDPGTSDLYRIVPCDYQLVCKNQHGALVPGSNLTFRTTSPETQYYYLFLVGCRQNTSISAPCEWTASSEVAIDYDIHIVNQDPELTPDPNPFIYEFSYHLIGMMVIYIIFSCIYLTVAFFHLVMHSFVCTPPGYKHHRITVIFTVSLVLEFVHVVLVMIHYCVFSVDGVGVKALFFMGQATNFLSDWLLILVLVLIGKGWQITRATVRWKKITLVVWILYIVVSAIFFTWTVVSMWVGVSGSFSVHMNTNTRREDGDMYIYLLPPIHFIVYKPRSYTCIVSREKLHYGCIANSVHFH